VFDTPTIWVCAIATLAVFSFLVKDNPFYRLMQHAALGAAVGIGLVVAWQDVLKPKWWLPISQAVQMDWHTVWGFLPLPQNIVFGAGALWLLALIPGSLWYFQLSKRLFWVSRLVSGMFIGVAAGLAFKAVTLLVMPQIFASLKNLNPWAEAGGFSWSGSFLACVSNLIFVLGLVTTLMYFFFSVKTDNVLMKPPMRFGRWMIMIALGSMFGATVMTRMAYLLERVRFLYKFWLMETIWAGISGWFAPPPGA